MTWFRRRRAAVTRRPDPLHIAILEYELFGIPPRPGSAAAFAIGLRRAVGGHASTAVTIHDLPPLPEWLTRRPD